jgi:hypothetical protein
LSFTQGISRKDHISTMRLMKLRLRGQIFKK